MDNVFNRFVSNIEDIKETWQIVEFFENEFEKFQNEVNDYRNNISKEQEILKKIRGEYLQLQDSIKESKAKLEELNKKNIDNPKISMHEAKVDSLQKVEIKLKDGIVVKANPASEVYGKELATRYISSLSELKELKAKLIEIEFDNAKLKNELKELKELKAKVSNS